VVTGGTGGTGAGGNGGMGGTGLGAVTGGMGGTGLGAVTGGAGAGDVEPGTGATGAGCTAAMAATRESRPRAAMFTSKITTAAHPRTFSILATVDRLNFMRVSTFHLSLSFSSAKRVGREKAFLYLL